MKIGVLGTGNMGRALGLVWSEIGHEVYFGARNLVQAERAISLAQRRNSGERVHAGSNDEAAHFGDVLLYTPRGVAPADLLRDVSVLDNKILVDVNNGEIPVDFAYPPVLRSHAEVLAAAVPKAKVVKAFNTLPATAFELSPESIREYWVTAFIASDDLAARQIVTDLAQEIGFRCVNCGCLEHARVLEGLADYVRMLLMVKEGMPDATFSLLQIPPAAQSRLGGTERTRLS
jgi:8-hydroxy-5-deazaflavin:NADPH oxidoreductase